MQNLFFSSLVPKWNLSMLRAMFESCREVVVDDLLVRAMVRVFNTVSLLPDFIITYRLVSFWALL